MNKVFNIALNDLRVTFSQRGVLFSYVVIPAVLIFIIGLVNGGFSDGADGEITLLVDVFNEDNSALSQEFLASLTEINDDIVLCPLQNTDEDVCALGEETLTAERAVERIEDTTYAIIEIPADFGERVLSGEPVDVTYRSEVELGQVDFLLGTVQAAIQRVSGSSVAARVGVDVYETDFEFNDESDRAAFQQAVYDEAASIWSAPPATVSYQLSAETDAEGGSNNSGFAQSVPGMGSMYVMANVLAGVVVFIQERKQWTLQRLVTMPVSRSQLLGGKMLARFFTGMIQYMIAFGVGFLLGVNYGNSPLALIAVMLAFTICITALSMALSTFVRTDMQAAGVINLLVLTLAPLGGAWWPLEIVPEFMQTIALISPIAWAMNSFNELLFFNGGFVDILPNLLVLLALAVVFFAIGILNFEYE